ncbi:MAG: hypothetical protein WCF46_12995, partial [Nitrososphaeraceae archaeon]
QFIFAIPPSLIRCQVGVEVLKNNNDNDNNNILPQIHQPIDQLIRPPNSLSLNIDHVITG